MHASHFKIDRDPHGNKDLALNEFIAQRWDELSREAKHGHYETLFRLVRDAMKFYQEQLCQ